MVDCDQCKDSVRNELTCDHCRKGRYCSLDCKTLGTRNHKTCVPQKNLRSVDYLLIDVWNNEFPTNKQTIEDYGFANCKNKDESINLLGLYVGLLKVNNVRTDVLHDYFKKNEIAELIKRTFEKLPISAGREYFDWFLQNQDIVKNRNISPTKQSVASVEDTAKKSKKKALPSAKFSIQDGVHIINYGYNAENSYYFLNIQDPRLAWQSGLTNDVERVTNDIDSSGEGIILQLHTCSSSSSIRGYQVSVETLAQFFKRYGIRNVHIEKMKQGKSF